MEQAIIWSIPFLALAVGLEIAVGMARGRNSYRTNDTLANLSQGLISQLVFACTPLLQIGIYAMVFTAIGYQVDAPFWRTWYGIGLAVLMFDFCEYWLHRAGHEIAIFWAAHVVHHQGEEMNLCTALRQESQNAVLGWPFYLPMALAGVPPDLFGFVFLGVQYYQIWAHTDQVGKLGWLDRVLTTPSNHRVHHAVNDAYLDRNYGGVLILWDRLFGTYTAETERCVFGTRTPVRTFNPVRAIFQVYGALARDAWHAERWQDKLRIWFMPPGWRPDDVALRFPEPPFDLERERYDPPASGIARAAAILLFLTIAVGCGFFLWDAETLDGAHRALWTAVLIAGLCGVGWLLEGRSGAAVARGGNGSPFPRTASEK
ncbi:MAG: sterol desaturase family protein [Pseudomonadota bacterium]|nr:sterol desaturase family protein [Pseudomonadota bacterium]